MASLMTEEFGVSHRQLQILAVLWDAGEPILRETLLERFRERFGVDIDDPTLRSLIRKMDWRDLLARQLAKRRPGTLGRTPTLYSPNREPEQVLASLLDTVFSDVLNDEPRYLEIALERLQGKLAKAKKAQPKGRPEPCH